MFFGSFLRYGGPGEQKGIFAKISWKAERQVHLYTYAYSKIAINWYVFVMCRKFSKAKKCPGVASSSLEMFLNCQPRMNAAYSQNLGCTGSPLHSQSPESQTKSPNLSVDLNSEGKKRIIYKALLNQWFGWFPS